MSNKAAPSSPEISLSSSSLVTSTNWHTLTTPSSDHLPILVRLQTSNTTHATHRTHINPKKAKCAKYQQKVVEELSKRPLSTNCHNVEKMFCSTQSSISSYLVWTGTSSTPSQFYPGCCNMMKEGDTPPNRICNDINIIKLTLGTTRRKGRACRSTRRMYPSCGEIKAINGKAKPLADNHAINFNDTVIFSPKQIINRFNNHIQVGQAHVKTRDRDSAEGYQDTINGDNDLDPHVVESSSDKRLLQIEITFILTVCCSSQRISCLGSVRSGWTDPHFYHKSDRTTIGQTHILLLQMTDDLYPNPGPTVKYPCPICTRNVTSRGVSYQCNRCSGWVHAKCSGLLNTAQYR